MQTFVLLVLEGRVDGWDVGEVGESREGRRFHGRGNGDGQRRKVRKWTGGSVSLTCDPTRPTQTPE